MSCFPFVSLFPMEDHTANIHSRVPSSSIIMLHVSHCQAATSANNVMFSENDGCWRLCGDFKFYLWKSENMKTWKKLMTRNLSHLLLFPSVVSLSKTWNDFLLNVTLLDSIRDVCEVNESCSFQWVWFILLIQSLENPNSVSCLLPSFLLLDTILTNFSLWACPNKPLLT